MIENENKPKYIKFADGRQGAELEVLTDDLAHLMPKEVRGKLAPSILWIARHYKTMYDDLRVKSEKVNELESKIIQLQQKMSEEEQARDTAVTKLAQSKRTIDQSRAMFIENKCPFCTGKLVELNGQYGKYVKCEVCGANYSGKNLELLRPRI